MNELSPRRFTRNPAVTPPKWKKPEVIMRKHKIRLKENALMARINKSTRNDEDNSFKRKNPFKQSELVEPVKKKIKEEKETIDEDSLFEILGVSLDQSNTIYNSNLCSPVITTVKSADDSPLTKSLASLPVDWTLRTKMRFISAKPFPWSMMLKTCEEASGITGFVRCLDSRSENGVDTSLNGRFHQSCLVWLQPNLPWLEVYPRHIRRSSKPSPLLTMPQVKEALQRDWANSFRTLFQLVRARHCPYFYVVSSTFTCLFRAAGINGVFEITASICPTTRGFRKLLTDDGINFSMPLKTEQNSKRSSNGQGDEDEEGEEDDDNDDDEKAEDNDWLASLGIERELCTIWETQETLSIKKEDKEQGIDETLVRVDGCEAQAFFNFLINCKSVIATTGSLAGVPPTLVSPVAFPGGTLIPLKVNESTVKMDGERFYTMEVRGPILPNTVLSHCSILEDKLESFSVTLANIDSTKAFTLVRDEQNQKTSSDEQSQEAFRKGALSDSGLSSQLLSTFCSMDLKPFDSIKFSSGYHVS